MTEAVIVATARSPIGRAVKGSLVDLRPDDMSAQIVRALMDKVPQVSGADIEDVIMGCGQPAGEAGFNIGRAVAVKADQVGQYVGGAIFAAIDQEPNLGGLGLGGRVLSDHHIGRIER